MREIAAPSVAALITIITLVMGAIAINNRQKSPPRSRPELYAVAVTHADELLMALCLFLRGWAALVGVRLTAFIVEHISVSIAEIVIAVTWYIVIFTGPPIMHRYMAFFSAVTWTALSVGFLQDFGVVTNTFPVLGLFSAWAFLRARRD
ncbi:MAG TPA: hypothetical protein VLA89_14510 [Gemmatimonadales bacterium]|nr:hypothetical protein [Gemmatimonadales bacterium]